MAMYRAKESGRNNYQFYTPDMGDRALVRMSLESSVRRALDREEFTMYYQPIVDLDSGQLVSLEALVRWSHPELGVVSPADFVPLAEETGLIIPLGEWILRRVCAEIANWRDLGIEPPRVSINLSSKQLNDHDLVAVVAAILAKAKIAPELLTFELTENTVMQNAESTVPMLHDLRKLGVRLAIDDFGTGYSSLSYLKRLPIDILKIDRSFVQNVPDDPDDSAIVEAIIALSHSLRLGVVAEGVEETEQVEFLRRLGCDAVQGYLCGRPVPAEETTVLLRKRRQLIAA
jgi:EAL domain-containing protein (putative c-di-GMP-specific phosphodiesterase class I)